MFYWIDLGEHLQETPQKWENTDGFWGFQMVPWLPTTPFILPPQAVDETMSVIVDFKVHRVGTPESSESSVSWCLLGDPGF